MKLQGLYNIESLDKIVKDLNLEKIPDYTEEMEARKNELNSKFAKLTISKEEREEYAILEFIKSADYMRDKVMLDWKIEENEKADVEKALQSMARVIKLKAGVDSY